MTILLTTQSGSHYELEPEARRIRRVTSTHPPTTRQGRDGEWKSFAETSTPNEGESLVVVWRVRDDGVSECLITSPVAFLDTVSH